MTEQPDYIAAFRSLRETVNRVLGGSTHEHDWDIVDTWQPETMRPVHPRMQGTIPQTFVLIVCKICHLPQTIGLDGKWTTEQVQSKASEQPSRDNR